MLAGALALGACGDDERNRGGSAQPQGAKLRITLGTQDFPEARLLGELWRQALAVNGYTVNLRKRIGPAEDLDRALRDGDIDGHVAYTGTVLSIVAGEEVSGLDPEKTFDQVKAFYATREHGDERDDAVRGRRRDRHHRRVRAGARARVDPGPARARRVHARGAAGVRVALPGARGPRAGLRAHERDVRGRHARRAVHRARRGRRGRRQRVHHRPAARERRLRGARGSRVAVRLAERRDGGRRPTSSRASARSSSCAWSTRSTGG